MSDELTQEQLRKMIYDKEYQKKRDEAEQAAIDELINGEVKNRFANFGQCARCGKPKEQQNNFPMCVKCTQIVDQQLQAEDAEFQSLEHFAGMDNAKKKEENK